MVGGQQVAAVQRVAEVDEPLIGDGTHPFEGSLSPRRIKEDLCMVEKALEYFKLLDQKDMEFLFIYLSER